MDILLIFVIAGVIILIGSMARVKKTGRLSEEGKLIKRDGVYWEEEQFFELDAPYEAVSAAVKSTDYSDCAVKITHNYNGKKTIFFESSHRWNAALKYLGTAGMKYRYNLSFTWWKTRNGMPYNVITMNVFLTQTEKMLLSLDPETTVETHKMKLKTKTPFI